MRVADKASTTLVPLLLALAATFPLLLHGPSCGHDFDFHLQSWLAVHDTWHAGLLVPHWVPAANYGAGEPRFLFYPPLTWLLGAALGSVLPWVYVPAAFTFLCYAGAAAAMQQVARRYCSRIPAAVAATLYTLSPYLLFTGYERTAYGELLASAWMPLLLGTLLRERVSIPRTALMLAALWYTNAPAAVMGCYLVLLVFAWRSGARLLAKRPSLLHEAATGATALTLGCALSADYLLPAWYEQRYVAIRRAIGPGMQVDDSFLFMHTGAAFHDQVLHTASSIAVATFSVAAIALAALLLQPGRRGMHGAVVGPLATALAFCLLLQFSPSAWVWHHLQELDFLQFPWRLLLPASAAAALLCGMALPPLGRHMRVLLSVATLLAVAALTLWTAQTRFQPCDDEDNVSAQLALLRSGAGFAGTDEYAARSADNGEIQQGLPFIRLLAGSSAGFSADEGDDSGPGDDAANPRWQSYPQIPGLIEVTRQTPESFTARIRPDQRAFAVFKLERYPSWQVLLNGSPCAAACVPRDDGLLTIALPANRQTTVTARYVTPWDVLLGRVTTCAATLSLLPFWRVRSRPKRSAMMKRK